MTPRSKRLQRMSRLTPTLKQNPAREPPSLLPPHTALTFSHSHSFLFHSFILSLLSSKVVALFHSLPWARGEQCKHTLLPWILVRNPIRPSYSPYSFSFFSVFLFSFTLPLCQGKGGNLNRLAVKANSSLFSLFFFPAVSSFFLPCLCKHKHILSINRKGQKRWEWKRLLRTKDIIIDCKLRNISQLNHLRVSLLLFSCRQFSLCHRNKYSWRNKICCC